MPDPWWIKHGRIYASVYIFLKAAGRLSDLEVLQLLELKGFQSAAVVGKMDRHVFIAEDASWIHVLSDWYYSLFAASSLKGVGIDGAGDLSGKVDSPVFMCWIGEADDSFGFSYAASGRLRRIFEVVDQHWNRKRRIVVKDWGTPMKGERHHTRVTNEYAYLFSLAHFLGITVRHDPARVRCYVAPPEK